MKKLILTAICSLGALSGFSQGAIDFTANPDTTTRIQVWSPQVGSEGVMTVGNSSLVRPTAGTTVYTGVLLQSGYNVSFFASAQGSSSNQLTANGVLTTLPFRTAAGNVPPAGVWNGVTTVNVPGVAAGSQSSWQIRVWNTLGGTVATYDAAFALYQAGNTLIQIGWTPIITSGPLGGTTTGGPVLDPTTLNWQSFSLIQNVPEPTTIALAGLGAASLLLFRRRK